jgi:ADP-heptose:LPS heptosyltransferase
LLVRGTWSKAANILCVRLDTLGDVLMTGPAMRALSEGGRRITLLSSGPGAEVAQLMPEVHDTIVFEAPWMKRGTSAEGEARAMAMLRERRFDAAAIFTSYTQSALPAALMCRSVGIPLRLAHCRENPYELLTHWVPESEPDGDVRHEARRQLDLVATVGAIGSDERLRLRVPEGARHSAGALLPPGWGDAGAAPLVVVHAGGTASSRRYPPELWARACRLLSEDGSLNLVFTGQADERGLVEEVREAAGEPGVSLAGRLGLAELAALIDSAAVLVSGNTGPVHVAAATATPVVDLYALTNPQHTPWRVPSRLLFRDVPCRWCYRSVCPEGHHLCLRGVEPEAVVAAVRSLLQGEADGAAPLPPVAPGPPRSRQVAEEGDG